MRHGRRLGTSVDHSKLANQQHGAAFARLGPRVSALSVYGGSNLLSTLSSLAPRLPPAVSVRLRNPSVWIRTSGLDRSHHNQAAGIQSRPSSVLTR